LITDENVVAIEKLSGKTTAEYCSRRISTAYYGMTLTIR